MKFTLPLLFLFSGSLSFAAKYEIDSAHSNISFEVDHLVIATVIGGFKQFSGSFDFDHKKEEFSNFDISIVTKSIDTAQEKRDEHLKSGDFFNADKNPTITFKSPDKLKLSRKKGKLKGILNMRGVNRPVTLDFVYKGSVVDGWGNAKVVFNINGVVDRQDFGVSWNKTLDKGGLTVGNEVKIRANVEAGPAAK